MNPSCPTPSRARPIPQKLDARAPTVSSPSSPASPSPYTPSSTFSSDSATMTAYATDYFGDSLLSSPSDRSFFHRITSSTFRHGFDSAPFRHGSDGPRTRSKSPSASRRPKSCSVVTTTEQSFVSSNATSPGSPSTGVPPPFHTTVRKEKRASGTYTDCGRHSNEWLFGGVSVRETVKGLFEDRK